MEELATAGKLPPRAVFSLGVRAGATPATRPSSGRLPRVRAAPGSEEKASPGRGSWGHGERRREVSGARGSLPRPPRLGLRARPRPLARRQQAPSPRRARRSSGSIARGLAGLVSQVDVVLSSPYVRAWRTAQILSELNSWPAPEASAVLEPTLPPEKAAQELLSHADARSIAVVGHRPATSSPHTSSPAVETGWRSG